MKPFLPFIALLLAFNSLKSQVITQFTWNSNPVTKASIGPDAISVSSSATSAINGVGGTSGLNPGLPNKNIDLTLTGSYYDVPGIDISLDFRREESEASFFKRGSLFDFGMNGGKLNVKFNLQNGTSGTTTVNSGNIFDIPNDHSFHHYRFRYDYATGIAQIWVDNVLKYTYTGTAGYPLYWTGAGNAVIGTNMDATSNNVAVLDNLIISNTAAAAALPLQLLSFDASAKATLVVLNWATTKEINTHRFIVERSENGLDFAAIGEQKAAGDYSNHNTYQFEDAAIAGSVLYYRLKMVDIDGSFTYSPVRKISIGATKSKVSVSPNPASSFANLTMNSSEVASYSYSVRSISGQLISTGNFNSNGGTQQIRIELSAAPKGVLFIQLNRNNSNEQQVYKLVKQ